MVKTGDTKDYRPQKGGKRPGGAPFSSLPWWPEYSRLKVPSTCVFFTKEKQLGLKKTSWDSQYLLTSIHSFFLNGNIDCWDMNHCDIRDWD